jgi:hypothetical protein
VRVCVCRPAWPVCPSASLSVSPPARRSVDGFARVCACTSAPSASVCACPAVCLLWHVYPSACLRASACGRACVCVCARAVVCAGARVHVRLCVLGARHGSMDFARHSSGPPASAPGSLLPHLHRMQHVPDAVPGNKSCTSLHICARTRLSPLPHLHRDWEHRRNIGTTSHASLIHIAGCTPVTPLPCFIRIAASPARSHWLLEGSRCGGTRATPSRRRQLCQWPLRARPRRAAAALTAPLPKGRPMGRQPWPALVVARRRWVARLQPG